MSNHSQINLNAWLMYILMVLYSRIITNYLSLCDIFAASEPLPEHPVSTTDTSPTPPASPRNESGQNWLKSTQLLLPQDQRVQGSGLEKLVLSSIHFVSLCGSYGKLYNENTEREYAVKHVHTLQITDVS